MPERLIKKRGGAIRWARMHPPGRPDVYLNLAVTRKEGPRGGRTVAGEPHHIKKKKVKLGDSLKRHRKRKAA